MEFFYISNSPEEVSIIEKLSVDWLFIDLEIEGKNLRQHGRDTVISSHTFKDIDELYPLLTNTKLVVRSNPIGKWSSKEYKQINSRSELIDMVMLPFFKTPNEVRTFLDLLNIEKIEPCLLIETISAVENLEEIMNLHSFNYVHIGLNDLHIERKTKSMFEPFMDGLLQRITDVLNKYNVRFGIGGIGKIGTGLFPSPELVINEHIRLGSSGVILSRSFKGSFDSNNKQRFESDLSLSLSELRNHILLAKSLTENQLMTSYNQMRIQMDNNL